jgi:hypothetical protein
MDTTTCTGPSPRSTVIDKDMIVPGHYNITCIPTGEKREYGELHLRKRHDDYEIAVENNIAKGERHDLPLRFMAERDASAPGPPMKTMGATKHGAGHIEADIVTDQKEDYIATVPENTSTSKEKVVLPDGGDIDARDQGIEDQQTCLSTSRVRYIMMYRVRYIMMYDETPPT